MCLYSAASIFLRSLSAALKRVFSNGVVLSLVGCVSVIVGIITYVLFAVTILQQNRNKSIACGTSQQIPFHFTSSHRIPKLTFSSPPAGPPWSN